jgi:hypothetical protein
MPNSWPNHRGRGSSYDDEFHMRKLPMCFALAESTPQLEIDTLHQSLSNRCQMPIWHPSTRIFEFTSSRQGTTQSTKKNMMDFLNRKRSLGLCIERKKLFWLD